MDVICPRCYLAVHRLKQALARFEHRAEVQVVYRGVPLDPVSGRSFNDVLVQRVMHNHRMTRAKANSVAADVQSRLREEASREGLICDSEIAGPVDTFDAHRMLHLAAAHGLRDTAVTRIQEAYFAKGMRIGDPETLAILVAGLGIDFEECRSVAVGDAYVEAVLKDRTRAEQWGITTVPFFLFGERYALSGAQSPRTLLEMLRRSCADDAAA